MTNLYRILEVENFAPIDVVIRSYRRIVMKYHPDRAGGNQEIMKRINSAYDDLKRYKDLYDAKLREYLEPAPMMVFTVRIGTGWTYSGTNTGGYEYTF
jgi:curved DNA-binding protein CbpA